MGWDGITRASASVDDGMLAELSSPPAETRARLLAVHVSSLVAIVASTAYLTWRGGWTIRSDFWIAIPLWILELHALVGLLLFTFSLWDLHGVPPPPEVADTDLRVAVLIATYNEPREVLLPTIAAAVALAPDHDTWVLDDGRRRWVQELASTLGARYLTREDRSHAKAGNINHALEYVDADIVAILDADHVAASGFLTHTLGYFDDPSIGVVQTPQEFYNVDSFEHGKNRSLLWRGSATRHFSEQRLFYRALQPGKNRWRAAFWCGTNALVRLSALEDVGGVAHESVTEDIHTTIRMHRKSWRTVFHNEVLAYGLAARNAEEYFTQRLRWGTGAMQVLHMEHPITGPGLDLSQRIAYASTLLGWFDSWRTLGYILVPPAVLFSGAVPVQASALLFLVAFGGAFVLQRVALAMLSRGYAPQGMAMLFEVVRMQTVLQATLTYLRRKERAFAVTAKAGATAHRRVPAPRLIWVLLGVSAASAVWFGCTLAGLSPITYHVRWTAYGAACWLAFNAALLVAALLRVRADRFAVDRRTAVRLKVGAPVVLGEAPSHLLDISMGGALVRTPAAAGGGTAVLRLPFGRPGGIELYCVERGRQAVGEGGAMVRLQFAHGQEHELGLLASALFAGDRAPAPAPVPA